MESTFTEEDRQMLVEVHAILTGLAEAIGEVASNPVAGAMLKNFGVALPKIA